MDHNAGHPEDLPDQKEAKTCIFSESMDKYLFFQVFWDAAAVILVDDPQSVFTLLCADADRGHMMAVSDRIFNEIVEDPIEKRVCIDLQISKG